MIIPTRDPGMIPCSRNNTRKDVGPYGEIELRYITIMDGQRLASILNTQLSDREFTVSLLYHQIVKPNINHDEFTKISDEILGELAALFMERNSYEFEQKENGEDIFAQFRKSYLASQDKHMEDLCKRIEPAVQAIQRELRSFQSNYSTLVQPVIGGRSFITESLQGLTSVAKHIHDNTVRVNEALLPAIRQIESTSSIITNSLVPQIKLWQTWADQNSHLFERALQYLTQLPTIAEVTDQQAAKILKKYKWFVTPGIPLSLVVEVIALDKKKGRQDKAVNKLFIDYFEKRNWKNLNEMARSWKKNPLLKKRYRILIDCVEIIRTTHKPSVNVANIVLPTLITQIDGSLSDYLSKKGMRWECDYDDLYDKKAKKIRKVGRKSRYRLIKPEVLTKDLDNLANDIFLNILFQRSQRGKPLKTPFNFNRHKIIHGENVKYGRRDYVVRAFMVLDLLASL